MTVCIYINLTIRILGCSKSDSIKFELVVDPLKFLKNDALSVLHVIDSVFC